ncbi:MAG: AbrB/MazE/SpoVT family DNA-binding domain-containing protein [Gemmatimonadota bacterium]|nr:AbrB/MazE/SpoVT family DNA-binding domain-containing protein [Gemmatimonadota bacterium]
MKSAELKVARIGNSRGIRIPAKTLARYHIGDSVIMEERPEGILLRKHGASTAKLSWQDTATAIAAAREDWSEWETTSADGLSDREWTEDPARRVAEPSRERSPESGQGKAQRRK